MPDSRFQAVVVLAHMDFGDELVGKILAVIRSVPGTATTPVAVLAGHTHCRGFRELDPAAVSLEAGRYFDTVGVLTLNLNEAVGDGGGRSPAHPQSHTAARAAARFDHVFVDANQGSLTAACGRTASTFPTVAGALLKAEIAVVRGALGLDRVVGCSPRMYKVEADFERDESLWRLYMMEVLPLELFRPAQNPGMVAVASTGALRYGLYPGTVTRDDCFTISPFRDSYYLLETLSAAHFDQLVRALRASSSSGWVHSPIDETAELALALVVTTFDLPRVTAEFERTVGRAPAVSSYRHDETDSSVIWEQFAQGHLPCAAPVARPMM